MIRRRKRAPRLMVALAVLLAGLSGAVWARGRLWDTRAAGAVVATAARPTTTTAPTTTSTEPPPPTTIAAPPPAPAAAAVGPTSSNPSRRVRVGVARPVGSPATVADAVVPRVGLYDAPGDAQPAEFMRNPTAEGLPLVFLVMQQQGDWLEVQLALRPNEATAWIRASDVSIRQDPFHIAISLSGKHLTAFQGQTPVLEASVAPGRSDTPTPTGTFFIDGIVKITNPTGPYGAYQLSVAAFSNVLTRFGSGNGQIAIHGTNDPALIGQPASHGCVRMTNEDITRLASLVPTGTPVEISG